MTTTDETMAGHQPLDTKQQLKEANERAERAERELLAIKSSSEAPRMKLESVVETSAPSSEESETPTGIQELRKDSMMAHLLDALDAKKDIGHYGRLVFAMVARHFISNEDVIGWLQKDSDFSAEAAAALLSQVEERGYNPPKRERILEWQMEQSFPILPNADDPDCGNLYRNLKFPDSVYGHIQQYREEKVAAGD